MTDEPFIFSRPVPPQLPPRRAMLEVLLVAGASLFRDAVDSRVVEQVLGQGGGVIDSQDEVGGWPTIATWPPAQDADRDGMADPWESSNGLDPDDPGDHAGNDLHPGHTNLEVYLNQPVGDDEGNVPPGCA